MVKVCSSCNREVTGEAAEFKCPECGNAKIVRCAHCRKTVKTYKCQECGFVGP